MIEKSGWQKDNSKTYQVNSAILICQQLSGGLVEDLAWVLCLNIPVKLIPNFFQKTNLQILYTKFL